MADPTSKTVNCNGYEMIQDIRAVVHEMCGKLAESQKEGLEKTQIKLSQTESELRLARQKQNQAENDAMAAQSKLSHTESDLRIAQEKQNQAENDAMAARSKLNQTEGYLRATQDQLNQTKDDLTANRGKLSQTEGDLRAVQEKLSHTENTLTTAQGKLNQTEGDLKTTQDKLSQTENTLTATLGKLNQTANDLRATQEKLKDTETDLMATRDRLKQAEGDLAEKNSKIAGFESRFGGFDSAVDSFVEIMEKTFSCESTKTILSVIGVTRDNMRRTEVILKFIRLFGPEFTYAAKIYNNMRDFKKANRTGVMDAEKQLISTLNQFHRDIDKVEFDILELTDVSKPETLFDKLAMQDFDKPADITFRYIDSIYVPALRKDAATIQFKAFIKGIR